MRGAVFFSALLLLVTLALPAQSSSGFPPGNFPPNIIFRALEKAYPGWAAVRNPLEGPAICVDGKTFAWAEGRLLPAGLQRDWPKWAPQPFYEYPAATPDVARWSDGQIAQAEARLADRRATNLARNPDFFDTLWSIHDRASADEHQQKTWFFGLQVSVHKSLAGPLRRIEARLAAGRKTDPALDRFLRGLDRLEGYNYRVIAETQTRSNHAYGSAIDVIPRSYGGKNPYWLWAPQEKPGWYRSAWARRWEPHPAVVRAFEEEGFVWGGKWLLFDTIHFEYRPEILVLNGLR